MRAMSIKSSDVTRHTHTHTHTHTMAAAAVVPGAGGRKKRDDLWSHFRYSPQANATECLVRAVRGQGAESNDGHGDEATTVTTTSCCGFKLAGKNTTNLKRHLKASHPAIFAKVSYLQQ